MTAISVTFAGHTEAQARAPRLYHCALHAVIAIAKLSVPSCALYAGWIWVALGDLKSLGHTHARVPS